MDIKNKHFESEYKKVCQQELDFLIDGAKRGPSRLEALAAAYIPSNLDEKLGDAFAKAFEVILKKGTGIIGASILGKEQESADDAIFKSKIAGLFDTAATFAEGAGMGIVGLGLPDIPIFTAMVFRNIYQKAALYGFGYEEDIEKVYVLKLIATALSTGKTCERLNEELDKLGDEINRGTDFCVIEDEDIKEASDALAGDMLYVKFVQGIPIIGAVGGLFNFSTMRRINNFAEIKYHKRYLLKQKL